MSDIVYGPRRWCPECQSGYGHRVGCSGFVAEQKSEEVRRQIESEHDRRRGHYFLDAVRRGDDETVGRMLRATTNSTIPTNPEKKEND